MVYTKPEVLLAKSAVEAIQTQQAGNHDKSVQNYADVLGGSKATFTIAAYEADE